MRKIACLVLVLAITGFNNATSQTGPGGVGNTDGSSTLKLWFRTDSGVVTTGALIDSIINSAGVAALDIGEVGGQRPTLVSAAVNGFDEISFSGSNRLRSDLTLTTSNFVTNSATSFTVCRADVTSQTSCVYTTDPLVGTTRFSNHIPWSNTVYFDFGTCCGTAARMQVGSLTGLTSYSYWSYTANAASGKQLYRNGAQLQSRAGVSAYNSHASQRFNIGGNTGGANGYQGDVTEIIIYNSRINAAQRIIIENYLSAKYNITSAANDLYVHDDITNGNYDFDVAGIGRVDASNIHTDAQGTGIVRILNPGDLDNNEFLFWGHDNGTPRAIENVDVPSGVQARFDRVWRVSEVNASGTAVDVGSIDIRFLLAQLGSITASHLRLLVDTDNDGLFADETPISGATSLGSDTFEFTGITTLTNNLRFTLGTSDASQTPLPIELVRFSAHTIGGNLVQIKWQTATEFENDYFTIERSSDGLRWGAIRTIDGSGTKSSLTDYTSFDTTPTTGSFYYRLKQTDFNENSTYSNVIRINVGSMSNSNIEVYPNPFQNQLTIHGVKSEIDHILIINVLGQDVTPLSKQISQTSSTVVLDLSNLKDGVYYLKTNSTVTKAYKG